ncbi:DNA-processing protein DprA [bacterium SCSIO 12741]|nr:DNA-processing protein DprA [bacterium SCSIO 12741]
MRTNQKYLMALSCVDGIGPVKAKVLIEYCGSAEGVFHESSRTLQKIPGIGSQLTQAIHHCDLFDRIDREVEWMEQCGIRPIVYTDPEFPQLLLQCPDHPLVLYYLGNEDLNKHQVLSIVGTRKMSRYGQETLSAIISDLKDQGLLVVSGLAYGVDYWAHRQAIEIGLPTLGVLAHGLDRVYPHEHQMIAQEMISRGGLISEFMSGTRPDRENFPRRNRIIAGISSATLVVESLEKGGAMITAQLASQYNRDVLAIPGGINDPLSKGCNKLIRSQTAALITNAQDLLDALNWEALKPATKKRRIIPPAFEKLHQLFQEIKELNLVQIQGRLCLGESEVTQLVFDAEMSGFIVPVSGDRYQLGG